MHDHLPGPGREENRKNLGGVELLWASDRQPGRDGPPGAMGEVTVEQDSTLRIMEAYRAAIKDTLAERMGITIEEASAERVVGTMPVAGNTQPYGLLHGGASCVLAETLGSVGSALHAGPDRITVGIEISATHHRAVSSGQVTGVATLLYGGRTVTTYEIVISDGAGRRICTSRLTCLLSDRVSGREQAAGSTVGLP
jgi:uncharacterized protein (TIGR00369 family)